MRSIVGAGICTAFFLAALASPAEVSAAPGDVLTTSRTNVNVRADPSTDADIIARIGRGETVVEIDVWSEWHFVRLSNGASEGWIFSPLLEPVTASSQAQEEPASAAQGNLRSTGRTNVNVRAAPSTDAGVIAQIGPGDTVVGVDVRGEWRLVRLPGRNGEGWIFSPLLEPVAAPSPVERQPSSEPAALPTRTAAIDPIRSGDPRNGERVFYKCGACHTTVPGIHAQGPSLVDVFGRAPAGAIGYRYSGAMQAFARDGAIWDEATLDEFIRRPGRLVEGTSMPFSGVRDPQDRRDLIAYLQQLSN
ncbi:MAG: SH3 domain-containing protein [Pseudomonadota bacterium]